MATSTEPVLLPRIVSAAVTSVIERAEMKARFVFQIDVKWTQGPMTSCYRGYQDFYQFQCELLDTFPEEAGNIKGCNRIIPYLPGKKIFRRSTKNLALERLPELNQYVQEVIALPEKIAYSEIVMKFFKDNWREDTLQYFNTGDHNPQQPPPEVSLHAVKNDPSTSQEELVKSIEAIQVKNENVVLFSNMEHNASLSLSVEETNTVNEEESEAQTCRQTATTEDNDVHTIMYPSEIVLETSTEVKEEEKSDKEDSEEEGSEEEITVIDDIETQDDNTSLDPIPQDN